MPCPVHAVLAWSFQPLAEQGKLRVQQCRAAVNTCTASACRADPFSGNGKSSVTSGGLLVHRALLSGQCGALRTAWPTPVGRASQPSEAKPLRPVRRLVLPLVATKLTQSPWFLKTP